MTRRRHGSVEAAYLLATSCVVLAFGQALAATTCRAEEARRSPWRLQEAIGEPDRLSIEATFRLRYEYLDNQFRAGRPGSDQILALRTTVLAQLFLFDWLSVAAELQDSRAYLADGNTPVGTGLVNSAELLRAYIELSFERGAGSHIFNIGRYTMDLGSRRLVARNRFRNTSNAFTGIDWSWTTRLGISLRTFYALPVKRLPDDRASLIDNEIEFDETNDSYQFFGVFASGELPWGDRGELYAYGLLEDETYDASDGDSLARRRFGTPGLRILRQPEAGKLDYEFESALQIGQSQGSLTGLLTLDHFAHFQHVAIGYSFEAPASPRIELHYDFASGDSDPTDGKNGTFDTLFGARRFEYGPTSIYGAVARSNINTPGVRVELKPKTDWTAFFDYRAIWLASATEEWIPTGVRDATGSSGTFVGHQIEMRVRWWILPGNLLLEAGYAHLFAGEFIDTAPNSNHGDTNYVYTQMRLEL
jgi:hypothetical protein